MLALVLSGCAQDYTDIASTASRETAPNATDVPQLTSDEASFAFDFYRASVGTDTQSNVFFSPYSISVALAMTLAGTAGNTSSQIASAMHFTLPPDRLHTAFDALDLALTSRQNVRLAIANSIWGQRTLAFGAPFLDTLAIDYGSEVRGVDFIGASTQATNAINGWVSDQTAGKITNLLAPGSLSPATRIVLVNAVYFDGDWLTKFDSSNTAPAPFTKLDGTTVSAQMMFASNVSAPVAFAPMYTAIDIPYVGDQTSMLVILPNGGQFASVDAGLSGEFLAQLVASLQQTDVALSMPKITFQGASVSLTSTLQSMGMIDAFDSVKADLSPMSTSEKLYLGSVVHQAYLRVDENGSQAAAATSVGGQEELNVVTGPPSVIVNRPFFIVLRDRPTGAVLFVGRVMDPK